MEKAKTNLHAVQGRGQMTGIKYYTGGLPTLGSGTAGVEEGGRHPRCSGVSVGHLYSDRTESQQVQAYLSLLLP